MNNKDIDFDFDSFSKGFTDIDWKWYDQMVESMFDKRYTVYPETEEDLDETTWLITKDGFEYERTFYKNLYTEAYRIEDRII